MFNVLIINIFLYSNIHVNSHILIYIILTQSLVIVSFVKINTVPKNNIILFIFNYTLYLIFFTTLFIYYSHVWIYDKKIGLKIFWVPLFYLIRNFGPFIFNLQFWSPYFNRLSILVPLFLILQFWSPYFN